MRRPGSMAAAVWSAAVAIAVAMAGPGALAAQGTFEGAITIRMATATPRGATTQQVEYLMRGGKVRVNMAAPPGLPASGPSLLMVPQENTVYMLMAAQSAYMELRMDDSLASRAARRPPNARDAVKVVRTGRRETIAGVSCEHVNVTADAGTADLCLSRELGRFVNPTDAIRPGGAAWARELGNEFPLRVTMPDGTVPLEVVKVERKRLSNDLFTVPGSYTKLAGSVGRPPVR